MIYILINDECWKNRTLGDLDFADHVAVGVLRNGIQCKVISSKMFLDMVDNYTYPSSLDDKIYMRTLTHNVFKAANILTARGFQVINSYPTLTVMRDYVEFNSLMIKNKIPTVFLHEQTFQKYNLDRSKGFGQGFVDFLTEYVKEYSLSSFFLRSKHHNLHHKLNSNSDFSTIDTEYIWTLAETSPIKHYTRSRVIGKKFVSGSTLASSSIHYTEVNKLEDPKIAQIVQAVADAMQLEIGYVDILVDDTSKPKVFSVFENAIDTGPLLGIDFSKNIAKYLTK
jgi:hypothetical protein